MEQIGRYRVLEEIARGGMGVVFKARDPATQEVVALKLLHGAASEVARKRFAREAEALARVGHPGVVRVLDSGSDPRGVPFLALEFVAGESLQGRLSRRGPLSWDDAVHTAIGLAEAVEACHQAGVLHRDLKPDNVLVGPDGRPRLTDFGLARDTDPSLSRTRLSKTGVFLGTPGYWAPEQACGQLDQIGPATDVYGLGATLFALLTGEPPHQGRNLEDLLRQLDRPAPAPSSLRPDLPAWLDQTVRKCLARDPGDRFRSAAELAQALRAGEPDRQRSPGVGLALTLCLLGALAAGLIVAWARLRGSTTNPVASADSPRLPIPAPSPSPKTADHDPRALAAVERGLRQMLEDDPSDALETFTEAIRFDPDLAEAYYRRGMVRESLGDLPGAIADWDETLRLDPDSADAYAHRGSARAKQDDPKGAERDFAESLRLEPAAAETWYVRGLLRLRQNDASRAVADFDQAVRLQPGLAEAYFGRGMARGELSEFEASRKDFDAVLRLRPDFTMAYLNRGITSVKLDRFEAAVGDFKEALRLEPDAGWADMARQHLANAQRELDATRGIMGTPPTDGGGPSTVEGHIARGEALLEAENPQAALLELDRALALDPTSIRALNSRARSRLALGDTQGALRDFGEVIRLEPGVPTWYHNRGSIQFSLGQLAAARADFDRAIELDPSAASSYSLRGMLRARQNDAQGAEQDFDRALELGPDAEWAPSVRELRAQLPAELSDPRE